MSITQGELLEALAAATPGQGPEHARTVVEMSAETRLNPDRIRAALKLFQAQGRLQVHRVTRSALDGRAGIVPAYTIAPVKRRVR